MPDELTSTVDAAASRWRSQIEQVLAGQEDTIRTEEQIDAAQAQQLVPLDGQLRNLLLDGGIDLEGFPAILKISSLEHLRIRITRLNDSHVIQIADHLPRLRILNLPHAYVSGEGIQALTSLSELVQLRLSGQGIDDDAARQIARLPALRALHLIGPRITAEGLISLASSPHLDSLYIDDCPLPDTAWERLFAAKPQLHVHIDQQHHDRDPHRHPH